MARVALSGLSVQTLQKELARRQRSAGRLARKRNTLLKKLAALEAQMAELGQLSAKGIRGAAVAGLGRTRPKNKAPLPDSMAAVMSKTKAMRAEEIGAAVRAAGYKTTSNNFTTIIYQALRDKRFKKSEPGKYVLA